ncbi:MAG: glycosyltransferase [Spirochaetota bacterium]|nr:glycosyltransferase [Spirochaetota bacterium]
MSMKTKLLFVIPSLAGGGAERVLLTLFNNLSNEKYEISLVLFIKQGKFLNELPPDINIIDIDKMSRWDFFNLIFRLRKVIKDIKPASIIGMYYYSSIIAVLSCLFINDRPKIIVCEHGSHSAFLPTTRARHLKKLLMKFSYRKADKIVAISQHMKENLIVDLKLKPANITVINNPIPVKLIKEQALDSIADDLLNYKKGQIIISLGRLTQQKRFDRLIRAFSLVLQQKEVYLIILGQGELLNDLQNLVDELNVKKFVRFLGFKDNPFAWLSKADIFVLSSDWEGLPMVILEAMACGTPVIATDCPTGPKEIIINGENGFLVQMNDEKALAEAMLALLKDGNLRNKISKKGELRAEDFRTEIIIPQYEKLFDQC